MQLCKTHINRLRKVQNKLSLSQTMTHTHLILGKENQKRLNEANDLIQKAIYILYQIK